MRNPVNRQEWVIRLLRHDIRLACTAFLVVLLGICASSCGKTESPSDKLEGISQRSECYTYFTLSADKKVLTWQHSCPPNVLHRLWTGEKEIYIGKWQPGEPIEGTETMVAKAQDIQIPESLSKASQNGKFIGYIKCAADWSLVRVNLGIIDPSGKGTSYRRNGTYDLKYKGNR